MINKEIMIYLLAQSVSYSRAYAFSTLVLKVVVLKKTTRMSISAGPDSRDQRMEPIRNYNKKN